MQNINIQLLTECETHFDTLASLWYNELSRHWNKDATLDRAKTSLREHVNRDKLPLTFVALANDTVLGMASLRDDDGLHTAETPWLGSLVVSPSHRQKGVGELLIDKVTAHAKKLGFKQIYLFAFDPTLPDWYARLGWKKTRMDIFWDHPVTVMRLALDE